MSSLLDRQTGYAARDIRDLHRRGPGVRMRQGEKRLVALERALAFDVRHMRGIWTAGATEFVEPSSRREWEFTSSGGTVVVDRGARGNVVNFEVAAGSICTTNYGAIYTQDETTLQAQGCGETVAFAGYDTAEFVRVITSGVEGSPDTVKDKVHCTYYEDTVDVDGHIRIRKDDGSTLYIPASTIPPAMGGP